MEKIITIGPLHYMEKYRQKSCLAPQKLVSLFSPVKYGHIFPHLTFWPPGPQVINCALLIVYLMKAICTFLYLCQDFKSKHTQRDEVTMVLV